MHVKLVTVKIEMRLIYAEPCAEYVEMYGVSLDTPYDSRNHTLFHELSIFAIDSCGGTTVADHFWFYTEAARTMFILKLSQYDI